MKSTSALKMACLSVGLATAWAPLGGQTVHAGTQVDVTFNIGTTGSSLPWTYSSVAMGLVFSDNTVEIHDFSTDSFKWGSQYVPSFDLTTAHDASDVTGFMTVGLVLDTGASDSQTPVMISIASIANLGAVQWQSIFTSSEFSDAQGNSDTFLAEVLKSPISDVVRSNVLQDSDEPFGTTIYDLASLFEFSDDSAGGTDTSGNVSITLNDDAVIVPLPNACLMGGGLFALMALSKRSVKWIHLHRTQGLA